MGACVSGDLVGLDVEGLNEGGVIGFFVGSIVIAPQFGMVQ